MKIGHLIFRVSEVSYISKVRDILTNRSNYYITFKRGNTEQIFPDEVELALLEQKIDEYDRKLLTP